jgi:DNA-binding transcriptional LysR family regulator
VRRPCVAQAPAMQTHVAFLSSFYGARLFNSWSARKLAECPGVLVAAPPYLEERGSPNTPAEVGAHRCITLQISSVSVTSWTLRGKGTVHEVRLQSPLCGDAYLSRQWAIKDMGIAFKNLIDVIDNLEAGRLVRVFK